MSRDILRGQIYHIATDMDRPPVGCEIWSERPALVVSSDVGNAHNGVVEVVYLTTSFRRRVSPTHIKIKSGGREAIALCEQVHTVDLSRVQGLIGQITEDEQAEIDKALSLSLSLHETNYHGMFKKWEQYIRRYGLAVVTEQEQMREHSRDDVIATLRAQIDLLTRERDAYRAIAEAKTQRLESLKKLYGRPTPDPNAQPDD